MHGVLLVYTSAHHVRVIRREDIRFPGAGVTNGCELLDLGAVKPGPSGRTVSTLNRLTFFPVPAFCFFNYRVYVAQAGQPKETRMLV